MDTIQKRKGLKLRNMKNLHWRMRACCLILAVVLGSLSVLSRVEAASSITEKQLFMLAPGYLENDKMDAYFIKCEDDCVKALDSVSATETLVASYMEGLKSGSGYIIKEAASLLGITSNNFDSKNKALAGELLKAYLGNTAFMNGVSEYVGEQYSFLTSALNLSLESERELFMKSMKANNKTFTSSEIEKIFKDEELVKKIASLYGKVEDACKIIVAMLEMYQMEVEAIDQLLTIENLDSALTAGLLEIRNDRMSNPVTYILSTYGTDKVLGKLEKQILKVSVNAISKSATIVCKIAISAIKIAYEKYNPSMEDILHATLLQSYTRTADRAVNNLRMKFYKGTASEEDIVTFRAAFNFYVASLKMYMDKCKGLVEKKDRAIYNRLDVNGDTLGSTINYDYYLKLCLASANQAISAGTLVIKNDVVTKKTDKGTVIDEKYDSTASIAAKFAAIQEQYVPNVGQTWNGSYNGCIQCCGFAQLVFNKLFGYNLSGYYGDRRYMIRVENKVNIVGQLVGSDVTTDKVKAMFAKAKMGDYIQMDGASYGQHSAIVAGVDDTGVWVYDCNSKPKGESTNCLINQWKVTWANWVKWYGRPAGTRSNGISVYRAKNYAEIYGDGSNLFYDDTVNFVITDGVLTKYNGWQTYVKIPEEVTAIGNGAFKNNTTMVSVEIPDSVTSIGVNAFSGCTALVAAYIPDTVKTVGASAFYNCTSLTSVKLPENENFTIVNSSTFDNCKCLAKVKIPDSVTTIGEYTFRDCAKLSNVELPSKLVRLERKAFYNCDAITNIRIPKSLEYASYPFDSCSGLKDVSFEAGVTYVESFLFSKCDGLEEIIIPNTVTEIESDAFDNCPNLETVEIPDSVTTIEQSAFSGCSSLLEVYVPDTVTNMGTSVFSSCTSLKKAHLPDIRINLMDSTFSNCTSLAEVNLPDTLEKIGSSAFYNCKALKEVHIPEKVTSIGSQAFYGCTGMEIISIPASMRTIYDTVFAHCESLKTLSIAEGVTKMGSDVFAYCTALEEVTLPDSLQTLGTYAFAYCDVLSRVDIGAGLSVIPSYCFYENPALVSIVLPQQVTAVNAFVFGNCTGFVRITMNRNVSTITTNAFSYPDRLTICGVTGTYPETFADENLIAFEPLAKPVTAIRLSAGEKRLARGYTAQLTAALTPQDASDQLTWTSTDEDVVTVDATGKLTAKATGTASIIAMAGDVMELCEVTVYEKVTNVYIDGSARTMTIGDTYQLTAWISPANATNRSATWHSSDEAVVTVDEKGMLTAVGYGKATITVKTVDGGYTDTFQVTVEPIAVTGISLREKTALVGLGLTCQLTATVKPENATVKDVTWTSSKPAVATVENGLVTGVSEGTAIIIAKTKDGAKTASCTVTVKDLTVTGVTLAETEVTVVAGMTYQLEHTLVPAQATNQNVSWVSDREEIATVADGKVTAKKAGTATITVTTEDGGYTASCTVCVTGEEVTGVTLAEEMATVEVGTCAYIEPTVTPADAKDVSVTWTSSDADVAEIDAVTGVITAKKAGTAVITAVTGDGGYEASCILTIEDRQETTVRVPVTAVAISAPEDIVMVGDTVSMNASLTPEEATNTGIIWLVSDTALARISQEGELEACGIGTVTVTAIAMDNGKSASCEVTISPILVQEIVLGSDTLSLEEGTCGRTSVFVYPYDAMNCELTWTTSNARVVTVDTTGWITAGKAGTATITATARDGSGVSAFLTVTVTKKNETATTQEPTTQEPTTQEPTTQESTTQAPTPTPAPTPAPSVQNPDAEELLPTAVVGTQVTVGGARYRITRADAGGREVTYLKPSSAGKSKVTVPSTVKIQGCVYQVTAIADKAFKNNKKLKSVTIGKNVKRIGKEAFYQCKKLGKIQIQSRQLAKVGKNAIRNISKKAVISVPKKQFKKYQKLWKAKTGYRGTMKLKKR